MSTSPNSSAGARLSAADHLLAGFEQAWKLGAGPPLEGHLRQSPPEARAELFEGLLRIELAARHKHGKNPQLKEYLARFPDKAAVVTTLFAQTVDHGTLTTAPEEWYYLRNGVPLGPFQFNQLQKLALGGDLRPKDKVSRKGTVGWSEAGTVNGLFTGPRGGGELKQPAAGQWVREDYMLLEMIGRGGMGEIYKAYRFTLNKEVALKIIRFDRFHQLSPAGQQQVLQGFQQEMQATAKLRHEHIITIHDTGDLNGLPFYTMDFSESSLAQQLHLGPLPGAKAAEHLERVARAVEFAHQHHIIHRDIKPHNLLLIGGKAVLADLGLAAIQDKLFQGEVAGSPPYMAPEQVRGQGVDHRTDVYGLGATLYHLLTGRPPHQAADRGEVFALVLDAEPVPPRKLNPVIDRDLEAITLKCLEKEPEKRYQSAGELADDLERFLQGKPVLATRPTRWQRLKKWARREPVKAGLAACVLLLLFVLFAGGAVSNHQLGAALHQAQEDREEAKTQTREAAGQRQKAVELAAEQKRLAEEAKRKGKEADEERKRADDFAGILSRRLLRTLQKQDGLADDVGNLIKHADRAEEILRQKPDPLVKLDLADTYFTIYSLHLKRGMNAEAVAALKKCIDLQLQLEKQYPLLLLEVALNYLDLGHAYERTNEPDNVVDSDLRALDILQRLRSNNPSIRAAMGQTHQVLGVDYRSIKGKSDDARGHLQKAVRIFETLVTDTEKDNPTFQSFQIQLAKAYQQLGIELLHAVNDKSLDHQETLDYFNKAKNIYDGKPQYRFNLAEVYGLRSQTLLKLHQPDDALQASMKMQALADQLFKDLPEKSPQLPQILRVQVYALSAQAKVYLQKMDYAKAEELFRDSLKTCDKLPPKAPGRVPLLVNASADLADCLVKRGMLEDALKFQQAAIDQQEEFVAKELQDYPRRNKAGILWYDKGVYHLNHQQYALALECFLRAGVHEKVIYEKSGKGELFADNLYLTYQRMSETQIKMEDYKGAVESVKLRIQLESRFKYQEAPKSLSEIYQRDPRQLPAILALLDEAFSGKQLDIEQVRNVSNDLMDRVEVRELIRKYRK